MSREEYFQEMEQIQEWYKQNDDGSEEMAGRLGSFLKGERWVKV